MSSLISTNIGSPQGCVLNPLLFSIYVQHMPSPSAKNFHLLKYADDTVLMELLHSDELSSLQQASESLGNWCYDNELIINVSKTKEMVFSNLRFTPSCDYLILNDMCVDRVENFKYLGTILDSKLNFKLNSDHVAEKARMRIFIMKKLSFLGIAKPVQIRCYVTFIECCFLYHLSTIHGHISRANKKNLNNVIKLAGRLGDCKFDDIDAVYDQCMKSRCLRMFATERNNQIFQLDRLPSGRYRTLKTRAAIHSNCYRARAIKYMNDL